MYHEFNSGTKRDNWAYSYLGKDLIEFAKNRLAFFTEAENNSRKVLASLLEDKNVSAKDSRIETNRTAVTFNAANREKLLVWVHEFQRTPEREFLLSLGDVVFFGIVETPISGEDV